MDGKRGLIMGVANDRSIAWGIAKQAAAHGAELAFTYQGAALEKRVRPLADSLGSKLVLECDVTDETSMDNVFSALDESWGGYQRRREDSLMPAYSERMIWRAGEDDRFIELSKRAGPQAIEEMFGKDGLKQAYGDKGKP
mgnify:CR=1 FL=1